MDGGRAMSHTVHGPRSEIGPTDLERANLRVAGFYDLDDPYPEYGQRSLLAAYRAGWHDALLEVEVGRISFPGGAR